MTTNTGGPAFPQPYQHTEVIAKMHESGELTAGQLKKASIQLAGMTLRDYFAAKAMQGLLAGTTTSDGMMIAKDAYAIADAMLKEAEGTA